MITTESKAWGFFGTLAVADVADAERLFDATARELMAQLGLTADEARMALDSKIGRHIADQRAENEDAATLIARLIQQGCPNCTTNGLEVVACKAHAQEGRDVLRAEGIHFAHAKDDAGRIAALEAHR